MHGKEEKHMARRTEERMGGERIKTLEKKVAKKWFRMKEQLTEGKK